MSTEKKLPNRRDYREAKGFLEDFLTGSPCVEEARAADLADELIQLAVETKVQRATDRLVLYFDLNDDGSEPLPEATIDADGVDNGGEREVPGRTVGEARTVKPSEQEPKLTLNPQA